MLIYAPTDCYALRRYPAGIVPLYVPSQMVTVEVPDVWETYRLTDCRHSAVFHVTLPEVYTIPASTEETLIKGPFCVWGRNNQYSSTTTVPQPTFKGSSEVFTVWWRVITELGSAWYSEQLQIQYYWSGPHGPHYAVTQYRNNRPSVYVDSTVQKASRGRAQVTVYEPDWKPGSATMGEFPLDEEITLEGVMEAVNEYMPEKLHLWNYTRDYAQPVTTLPPDADLIKKEVAAAISSGCRFEEHELAGCHYHLTDEYDVFQHRHRKVTVGPLTDPSWVRQDITFLKGTALAYVKALEDFPRFSDNSLQNIAGAFKGMAHFVFDKENVEGIFKELSKKFQPDRHSPALHRVELPAIAGAAKDAWLAGRYEFSTTVADISQGWDYFYHQAQVWMGTESSDVKCHGKAVVDGVTFKCTFRMEEKALKGAAKFFEDSYLYGLEPNAYTAWDYIPFSFVVDWFVPIGDSLSAYTMASHFTPLYYEYKQEYGNYSLCFSLEYKFKAWFGECQVYCRWYESTPPQVEASYVLLAPRKDAKVKTRVFRCLDGLALLS